jgi:signal transduction histidine kinase
MRDEFIAVASHDLKAPLTSILAGSQYIERVLTTPNPDAAKAIEWARIIQDQARTMNLLINDFLDASRIQSGAFDLRTAPCEMNDCVTTAWARLGTSVRRRVNLTPAAPVWGRWDGPRIIQVLSNLLDNALKHSPVEETVTVTVTKRGKNVEVSVEDHGIGVSVSDLPRLTQRFYRAIYTGFDTIPGSGLGLYICDRIITTHGGRLWAESPGLEEGSTFRFTLPIQPLPTFQTDNSSGKST